MTASTWECPKATIAYQQLPFKKFAADQFTNMNFDSNEALLKTSTSFSCSVFLQLLP